MDSKMDSKYTNDNTILQELLQKIIFSRFHCHCRPLLLLLLVFLQFSSVESKRPLKKSCPVSKALLLRALRRLSLFFLLWKLLTLMSGKLEMS